MTTLTPRGPRRLVAVLSALVCLQACWFARPSTRATVLAPSRTQAPTVAPTTTSTVPLEAWTGPVEHLFFHPLIIRPELAFRPHDRLAQGFRAYFVTAGEFRAILDQLWRNGWTLVDIHRAVAGQVRVPVGRRPLVISEDDVNYYDYMRARGLAWRLVLGAGGDVHAEVRDDQGTRLTDDDLVPIVDTFVTAHPEFSAEGAKGVLALTGYQGLFGEAVTAPGPAGAGAAARVTALAAHLRSDGWTLAGHSFGHPDLTRITTAAAQRDTDRWKAMATPLIGPTDVYVYPFGAAPPASGPTVRMLAGEGFTIQCGIDVVPRLVHVGQVTLMARRHIDGIAFAQQARALAPLFDVKAVEDTAARSL
jgi:hypothetical protein